MVAQVEFATEQHNTYLQYIKILPLLLLMLAMCGKDSM